MRCVGKEVRYLAVMLSLAAGGWGCGDDDDTVADAATENDSAVTPDGESEDSMTPTGPVVLGGLLAETGELGFAFVGDSGALGTAVAELNAAGGPLGREIRLEIRDSATGADMDVLMASMNELIALEVPVILGGSGSGETLAALPIASAAGIPMISGAAASASLTSADTMDLFFRTLTDTDALGPATGRYLIAESLMSAVFLNLDDELQNVLTQETRAAFEAGGGTVAASMTYTFDADNPQNFDPMPLLQLIYDNDPDVVFLSGLPMDAIEVLRAWDETQFTGRWVLGGSLAQPELIDAVGSSKMEGMELVTVPEAAGPRWEQFQTDYMTLNGIPPDSFASLQAAWYDATVVAALAIHAAGSTDPTEVKAKLREVANAPGVEVEIGQLGMALELLDQGMDINYQGVGSDLEWDENGNITPIVGLYRFAAGELGQVRRLAEGTDF